MFLPPVCLHLELHDLKSVQVKVDAGFAEMDEDTDDDDDDDCPFVSGTLCLSPFP